MSKKKKLRKRVLSPLILNSLYDKLGEKFLVKYIANVKMQHLIRTIIGVLTFLIVKNIIILE